MKKDVILSKLSVTDTQLLARYKEQVDQGGPTENLGHEVSSDRPPHSDLTDRLKDLKPFLMRSLRMYDIISEAESCLKGEDLKRLTDRFIDLYQDVKITGFSISGLDALEGVVITGKIKNQMGGYTALNSPRIVFTSDKLGYEEDVKEAVDKLSKEVKAYLFERKSAQLDMFGSAEGMNVVDEEEVVPVKRGRPKKTV